MRLKEMKDHLEEWMKSEKTAGRIQPIPDDGWFDTDHLISKLVGTVIGIYQPTFEEPKRIVSCADAHRVRSIN